MSKNVSVKSTDPRKAAIVAALKAKGGATKVTNVVEVAPGKFAADGMVRDPATRKGFKATGRIHVELPSSPAPVRKSGPKKSLIQDACAADGCVLPPTDTGYCPEHEKAQKPLKAKPAAKAPKKPLLKPSATTPGTVELPPELQKQFAAMINEATQVTPPAKSRKAARKAQAPAKAAEATPAAPEAPAPVQAAPKAARTASRIPAKLDPSRDARPTLAKLASLGWSRAAIAEAMETSAGHVRQWGNGSGCKRVVELQQLLGKKPAQAQKSSGTLRASSSAQAAKAVKARPEADPRQMRLALEAIHDAVGMLLKKGSK